jgi:hypothetical protein
VGSFRVLKTVGKNGKTIRNPGVRATAGVENHERADGRREA